MERNHRFLTAAGGIAFSLAAISSACSGESPKPKNAYHTADTTAASCLNVNVATSESTKPGPKSITENRLKETIAFMKCSSVEPLVEFADKLEQLQIDGYLVLDNFATPFGVDPNGIANAAFYGGFPTSHDSSYRLAIDLNKEGMSYADFAIFLYKVAIVLSALNGSDAPNAGTKIASTEDKTSLECLAWAKTIKDVGIPLKGKVEIQLIKDSIAAYERNDPEGITDCIDSANQN